MTNVDQRALLPEEIFVGDIGTYVRMTLKDNDTIIDLSGTSTRQFIFARGAGGLFLVVTATFVTDGVDGQIEYPFQTGEVNNPGIWSWQAKIVAGSGTWYSEVLRFRVHETLPEA